MAMVKKCFGFRYILKMDQREFDDRYNIYYENDFLSSSFFVYKSNMYFIVW